MSSLNITDAGGNWEVTSGYIRNLKTGQSGAVRDTYKALRNMSEKQFCKECAIALSTGEWP